jgi:hypothetical protein
LIPSVATIAEDTFNFHKMVAEWYANKGIKLPIFALGQSMGCMQILHIVTKLKEYKEQSWQYEAICFVNPYFDFYYSKLMRGAKFIGKFCVYMKPNLKTPEFKTSATPGNLHWKFDPISRIQRKIIPIKTLVEMVSECQMIDALLRSKDPEVRNVDVPICMICGKLDKVVNNSKAK